MYMACTCPASVGTEHLSRVSLGLTLIFFLSLSLYIYISIYMYIYVYITDMYRERSYLSLRLRS